MEKRISQNLSGGFCILLVFNICAGISSFHINWFTIFSTLLIIWLNYMLTHSMKKMLIEKDMGYGISDPGAVELT